MFYEVREGMVVVGVLCKNYEKDEAGHWLMMRKYQAARTRFICGLGLGILLHDVKWWLAWLIEFYKRNSEQVFTLGASRLTCQTKQWLWLGYPQGSWLCQHCDWSVKLWMGSGGSCWWKSAKLLKDYGKAVRIKLFPDERVAYSRKNMASSGQRLCSMIISCRERGDWCVEIWRMFKLRWIARRVINKIFSLVDSSIIDTEQGDLNRRRETLLEHWMKLRHLISKGQS